MPDPSCRHRIGSPPGALQHTDDVLQFGEVARPFIVFGKRRQAVGGEQFLGGVAADVPAVVAEIAGGLVAVTQINQLGEVEVEAVIAPPRRRGLHALDRLLVVGQVDVGTLSTATRLSGALSSVMVSSSRSCASGGR